MNRYRFATSSLIGSQTRRSENPPCTKTIGSPDPWSTYCRRTPLTSTSLAAGADIAVMGIRRETSKGTIPVRLGLMMVLPRTRAYARAKSTLAPAKKVDVCCRVKPADGITLPVGSRCRQSRLIEQLIRQYLVCHIDASEAEPEDAGG